MIQKPFFGWSKPKIQTQRLPGTIGAPIALAMPEVLSLFVEKGPDAVGAPMVQTGDTISAGQRIQAFESSSAYTIAPAGGTVSRVATVTGDFGRVYLQVDVDTDADADIDDAFGQAAGDQTMDTLRQFLAAVPGALPLDTLADADRPIHTIVVSACDDDLVTSTQQFVLETREEAVKKGIAVLKAVTGIEKVVLAVPHDSIQSLGGMGAETRAVSAAYPAALPKLVMNDVLGIEVPAGSSCEDMGVCFVSAEAAANLGDAFETGRVPTTKIFTVINKAGEGRLVQAPTGTPVIHVLASAGIEVNDQDRVITGGPMRGTALYSTAFPIMPDTDTLMIQAADNVPLVSDYPCINCGECIPVCPANIQVSMLVRFLAAGQYQEAADEYDLLSCVDCGLCAFFCVAQIPIFQYIRLAKYELARIQQVEESNV